MAIAAAAALGSVAALHAGITLGEARRLSRENGHPAAASVRDSRRSAMADRVPGASGIASRPRTGGMALPARTAGEGPAVYGYLHTCTSEETEPGLYEFNGDGYAKVWLDSCKITNGGSRFNAGWVNGDRFCGYSVSTLWGMTFSFDYVELDMKDGSVKKITGFDYSGKPNISTAAYNTSEKAVYGYASSPIDGSKGWVRADGETPENPEFITMLGEKEVRQVCYSLTYNPDDDYFYGINQNQEFVRIDIDGRQTVISQAPDAQDNDIVLTGMVYSPKENLFYWNRNTKQKGSSLYTITREGTFTRLTDFSDGEEFTCLITSDAYTNASKPQRPEVASVHFGEGATDGSISFTMPSRFLDGSAIVEPLGWHALVDGKEHKSGTANPGGTVEVEYEGLPDGKHTFSFQASNAGIRGPRANRRIYIGNDAPKAPENVRLSKESVSWDAVSEGANGGYVDVSDMRYEVVIDGKSYGTTKDTELGITLPSGDIRLYVAEVYAHCRGKKSAAGTSNGVAHGDDLRLPVHFEVTEDEFNLMTIVDANEDGKTWWYRPEGLPVLLANWCDEDMESMDDYIFFPAIRFDSADRLYTYSMDILSHTCRYPDEFYEVVIATSPDKESVCGTIIGRTRVPMPPEGNEDPDVPDMQKVERLFNVKEPGTYYIGIHSLSAPYQLGFMVHDINISDDNITQSSPATANGLTATDDGQGKLSATVGLTFPTEDISGNSLPPGTQLTAIIKGEETATVAGSPGSSATVNVKTRQGDNKIEVVVSAGDANSPKAFVSVFTGVHAPKAPESVSAEIAPDMRSVSLQWPKVTEADDGGYLDPDKVEYEIYRLGPGQYGNDEWKLYAECGTSTQYVFRPEEQDLHTIAVGSKNAAGDCGKIFWLNVHAGTPYGLPIAEDFAGGYVHIAPWLTYPLDETYTASLGTAALKDIDSRWSDSEDYAMVATTQSDNTSGMFGLPRFSTKGCSSARMELDMLTGPKAPTVVIYGSCHGSELIEVGKVAAKDDKLQTLGLDLPRTLMGKDWVQLYILCRFPKADRTLVLNRIGINGLSSVEAVGTDGFIRGGKGEILFGGFAGSEIEIHSLDGRTVKREVAQSAVHQVKLDKGVYAVRCAGRSAKVAVR